MSISSATVPADRTEAGTEADDRPAGPPERDVVVGVDGSECALHAVQWAAREAVRRNARLRIIHAAPYVSPPAANGPPDPELPHARRITAKAYTVARHAAPEAHASTEVVPEDPVPVLLRAAAEAQLLVLGINTTGAADEMVRAAVAQRVAGRAAQPVVVVPRHRGPEDADRPVVAVLGLGQPEDDEPVAAFARNWAKRAGVQLSVLQTRAGAEDKRSERFPDLAVDREEAPRAGAARLLSEACPTPLLVLTAGHGSLLHRGLDGLHRYLLRHCTSPMALIPPVDRAPTEEPREDVVALG